MKVCSKSLKRKLKMAMWKFLYRIRVLFKSFGIWVKENWWHNIFLSLWLVATNYAWLLIIWFLIFLHWKKKFSPTKPVGMLTLVGWKKLLFHESMLWRLWVINIEIMGSQSFFSRVCVLFQVFVLWFIWFTIVFHFVLSFVVFMFHVLFFLCLQA